MTRREIVIETLNHRRGESVPYNIDFTTAMCERLGRHLGLASAAEVGEFVGNYCAQLNIGSVTGPSEGVIEEIYPRQVAEHLYRDDWGTIWKREPGDDIGMVVDSPMKVPSLRGFGPAIPVSRAVYLEKFCAQYADRFRLVSLSSPVFQRAWFLRGFENFLMDMALERQFAHDLLDMIMEYTVEVVREALEYDIDAIFFLDDWGQQDGLIMSPDMWHEYIEPRIQKLFDMAKEKNVFVFLHSCGDISCLIPDLIEMGLDVLNPIQPEVMDVYRIKEEYGDRLSFYGGISTQELLPYGKPEDVRTDVEKKIRMLSRSGGYILAPAHAVQADVPIENILALLEAVRQQTNIADAVAEARAGRVEA